MQVFGLPGYIIRNGARASRLLDAKSPHIEAARRRDALARWRRAMADGLTASAAARAVGAPRASLYRWQARVEPLSRRPHKVRPPGWSPALAAATERLRLDFPIWGCVKLGPRQVGAVAAQRRLRRLQRHCRTHHRQARRAPRGYVGARLAQAPLCPPLERQTPLCHKAAAPFEGHRTRRHRSARHGLYQPRAGKSRQTLHRPNTSPPMTRSPNGPSGAPITAPQPTRQPCSSIKSSPTCRLRSKPSRSMAQASGLLRVHGRIRAGLRE